MSIPPFAVRSQFACGLLALLLAVGAAGPALATQPPVGRVSLIIGEAHVTRADGQRELLRRGADIQVGDRIQTAANGHVHVRFIDNGVVSVRPESVLEVQAYRYDAQSPALNEVRLKLDQGATRSISGSATEYDKSRFRLNTPIAAIGVRGTDFLVHADHDGMRATVADGAIVVGPLTAADCRADALGPCGGESARVLSAGMGRLVAELAPGDRRTRLVPAADVMVVAAVKAGSPGHEHAQSDALVYGVNDRSAADLLTLAEVQLPGPGANPASALNRPVDTAGAAGVAGALAWGWRGVGTTGGDKVAVAESIAALGRSYTGIGDADFGLYRAAQTEPGPFLSDSLNASVDFHLTRAAATFETAGRSESASVERGALTIDFARRTFATGLQLSSASGARAELRAGGQLGNNGIFAVRDSEQVVAGAVSSNGNEAAYLFQRGFGGGLFKGRTLWGAGTGN